MAAIRPGRESYYILSGTVEMTVDGSTMLARNLGAGLSNDLSRWAIRPEIGFLISPDDEGVYVSYGLGFTVNPSK
ncbi:MAG: hypothetical protein IPK72_20365 [Candidatus Eisenbacteria bacterium]|nr:hypothetical protein [Candidatus Eisenbacteria bacterium]